MRSLTKGSVPAILASQGKKWLQEYVDDPESETKRFKYRHPDIKEALRIETGWKCVYCESRIGHSSPGDVEHKIPSSEVRERHFEWDNLTVACTECNRRKGSYYSEELPFIDPYVDPVETDVLHSGPLVSWRPGAARAELSVRMLEMHGLQRPQLVQQKIDVLERARALADLVASNPGPLQPLRLDELRRMQARISEYSACVRAFIAVIMPSALAA